MAMLLAGENGTEFELGLIDERMTEIQDGARDDVALVISFRVATADDSWEETAPCLNTFEVTNLLEWLEGVCGDRPDLAEIELLGPELRFKVIGSNGDNVTIRITFHIKDRPDEFDVDAPTDANF